MGIGAQVGSFLLALAVDLSLAAFGLLALMTLIAGIIIITNIGGQGLQKPIRQYIMAMFMGCILTGGFQAIARGLQSSLRMTNTTAPTTTMGPPLDQLAHSVVSAVIVFFG